MTRTGPRLRPLRDDEGGICDWGDCDQEAYALRYSQLAKAWLPVCGEHSHA